MRKSMLTSVSVLSLAALLLSAEGVGAQDPWVRIFMDGNCSVHGYLWRDTGWVDGNPASTSTSFSCGHWDLIDWARIWAYRFLIFKVVVYSWYLYVRWPGRWCRVILMWSGAGEQYLNVTLPYGITMNQTLTSSASVEMKVVDKNTTETLYYANASATNYIFSATQNWASNWSTMNVTHGPADATECRARIEPTNITIPVVEGHEIEGNLTATTQSEVANAEAMIQAGPIPSFVGGVQIPVDKFAVTAPYVGIVSMVLAATVATTFYVKRVKRRKT